jgi:hypothetical protein
MRASRGMGDINPKKMPKGKTIERKDDPNKVKAFAGGGVLPMPDPEKSFVGNEGVGQLDESKLRASIAEEQSSGANPARLKALQTELQKRDSRFKKYKEGGKVNAAGNYTKPSLRKKIVSQVKAAATHGTGAGQWSARKAQLVAKKYKAAGGGYRD